MANNVACVRTAHLHAHLDEDARKVQLQSWLSGEAHVMVAIGVIGCGYNYIPSGSSFIADLLDLLLLCTKSQANSLVTADRVSTE